MERALQCDPELPRPTITHDFSCDAVNTQEINTEAITEEEIRKAIKRLKN